MGTWNPATDKWITEILSVLPSGQDANPDAARLTDAECVGLIKDCNSDWKKVKDTYVRQPATMRALLAFRKKLTDGFLKMLGAQTDGRLMAKADGSTSLTSDIDVTVGSTDSSGIEIDAIVSFNDEIKRMFGKSPGIALDVNLYARDFFSVTDKIINADGSARSDPEAMAAIDETLAAEDRSDQDVAALMKQRQYMPVDERLAYKEHVLAGLEKIPGEAARGLRLGRLEGRTSFLKKRSKKLLDL